jgi:hypothetical protein
MNRFLPVILISAALALTSCRQKAPEGAQEPPQAKPAPTVIGAAEACPPEQLLRALHASSFHFQHGPVAQGRRHLAQAQELAHGPATGALGGVLAKLSSISARIAGEPDWAHSETEQIRLFFSEWRCIPDEMHTRFHEALPPIP